MPNLPALGVAEGLVPSGPLYNIKADYRAPDAGANQSPHAGYRREHSAGLAQRPARVDSAGERRPARYRWGVRLPRLRVVVGERDVQRNCVRWHDTILGIGVGLFSAEPFPLSFADIPLLWEPNAAAADVDAELNAVLSEVLSMVLGNETVAGILDPIVDQVLGAVEIPSL